MEWIRSVGAVVIGYVVMVAGAWIAQGNVFPGAEYGHSPALVLIALGLCTSVGAGFGGAVTALLAPRKPFHHLIPMALLILAETTALIRMGKVHGPLWFELLAGASLIAGTFIAAWLALGVKERLTGRARHLPA